MSKFILFAILILFSLSVTSAADNSVINDATRAQMTGKTYLVRINSPKAIVYADENLLSPLGYISNGKQISVGNPRRINPNVVPVVVYGKIGFIEIKDLKYEDSDDEEYNAKRGAPREHDIDSTILQPDEKLTENNSMYFSLHTYTTGNDVKYMYQNIDGVEKSSMTGFQLQFIHRQTTSKFFWGAGFDYNKSSSERVDFGYWLASPTFGYTLLKNSLFYFELYASLDLALNVIYNVEQNYKEEPSGYVWGPQVNARIILFPESKYHAFGGLGLRKYSLIGFDNLQDIDGKSIPGMKSISGLSLFVGFGMKFN